MQKRTEQEKKKILKSILKVNKMRDPYHVGIRTLEDIKTFEEVLTFEEVDKVGGFCYPDFLESDALEVVKSGIVTVYSSKPLKVGEFVATSLKNARDYAGPGGIIYFEVIPSNLVAWISIEEGQLIKTIKI